MKKILFSLFFAITIIANAQTTQISTPYCGHTATSTTEFIWADSLGLPSTTNNDRYLFKLVNGATTFTWITTNEWPIMQWYFITGFSYNTSYTASVAWSSDYGATFGAYGSTCTIISPSIPTTSLSSGSCGSNPVNYSTVLYADPVVLATQYEYRLENAALSYTQTYTKPQANFNLAQFTGLQSNTIYSVTIRPYLNNVWNPYGNVCTVTTPQAPTTSLQPSYCGITATGYSQVIYAEITVGDSTMFRLENASLGYSQVYKKSNFNFNLAQFTGLQHNTTYTVTGAVRYNGIWGSYGNPCTLTTPSAPTTSIQANECGTTATSYSFQLFHSIAVAGASNYTYKLENSSLSYSQEYEKTNNNFILSQFTGLQHNTTYTVSVKVKYNGSYGSYGPACSITTPASNVRLMNPISVISYPNPFTDGAEINISSLNEKDPINIRIFDKDGKSIETYDLPGSSAFLKVGSNYYTGIYNVIITQGSDIKTFKIIKN